jgi:hypothetical protein
MQYWWNNVRIWSDNTTWSFWRMIEHAEQNIKY